ncbi:MAG: ComEA family DNA-binding protein [Gemmatimonadales bacterium]
MSAERRALLVLLGLAVAGQGVRYLLLQPEDAPGAVALLPAVRGQAVEAHADSARAANRPLGPGERIDVDRASAGELARLPRVGAALARRIVDDREAHGPFGALQGLDRVPGIGPAMLRRLEPHVEFSGRPGAAAPSPLLSRATACQEASVGPSACPPVRVNVNIATAAELERLPFIGPSRALAIIAWRERHGSFTSEDDLVRVPGVSRRMVEAIRDRVAF